MSREPISETTANFLLSKVQEILDERNNNKTLTPQEQDIMLNAVNHIERLLRNNYKEVSFNILTGEVGFKEPLTGEMLDKEALVELVHKDEPDRRTWRVNWENHKSPCFYVEALYDFGTQQWSYHAETHYSRRVTNLDNIRVGGVRKPIKELRSYNGPFEYARKIAYAVMHGAAK